MYIFSTLAKMLEKETDVLKGIRYVKWCGSQNIHTLYIIPSCVHYVCSLLYIIRSEIQEVNWQRKSEQTSTGKELLELTHQ